MQFVAKLLQVRSSIPIQCVCAVERVDENAFQQQNVMQLVTQNNAGEVHIVYIQCKVTVPVKHERRSLHWFACVPNVEKEKTRRVLISENVAMGT